MLQQKEATQEIVTTDNAAVSCFSISKTDSEDS
jgi:hypothetical protein